MIDDKDAEFLSKQLSALERSHHSHQRIIFGDGTEEKGLLTRLNRLEDRVYLFWKVIGLFGSTLILAIVNITVAILRR